MAIESRFKCTEETKRVNFEGKELKFSAYDRADWAKYTPSGTITILINNENVVFELGAVYKVTFEKVDE